MQSGLSVSQKVLIAEVAAEPPKPKVLGTSFSWGQVAVEVSIAIFVIGSIGAGFVTVFWRQVDRLDKAAEALRSENDELRTTLRDRDVSYRENFVLKQDFDSHIKELRGHHSELIGRLYARIDRLEERLDRKFSELNRHIGGGG